MIGASYYQAPAFIVAKKMGLNVIAVDRDPTAYAASIADEFYPIDFLDIDRTVELAIRKNVSGSFTMQSDIGIPTVGAINEALGLVGVTSEIALACSHKTLMRDRLAAAGVSQPRYVAVQNPAEAEKAAERIGYPCMIKASDSSGSRGVVKVHDRAEIEATFQSARSWSRSGVVLVEEFIRGCELGAQTFHVNGSCVMVLPHNDTVASGPFPVPVGHSFPVVLSEASVGRVKEQCARAGEALGITHGPVNVDLIIDEDGEVQVIEVGARIGATCLPELVWFHTGIDWIESGILAAMGGAPSLLATKSECVAARILEAHADGILKAFAADASLLMSSCLLEWEVVTPIGKCVSRLRKGPDRIGKVIAGGDSVQEAEDFVARFAENLKLEVAPIEGSV